ncbi:MAG: hypothetical protein ACOYNL_04040 [Rickettsiales bacterium]
MIRHLLAHIILVSAMAGPQFAAAADDRAKLTVGVPAYVYHSDERVSPKGWNDGWFNNEGALVDITWPIANLTENTTLRAGATAGGFDNSIFRTSIFAGGAGEIETYISPDWTLSFGSYAGLITGYNNAVNPAIAPYIGTTYAIANRIELGMRGYWLPAKTIGGSDLAESDAYVGAITIGTRF